jgi:hypothetical protein
VDGSQIGVIGLVIGVPGLAELFGGQRVDDTHLEVGGGEGALHRPVVAAGALHGNQKIVNAVFLQGLPDLGNSSIEAGAVVLDDGRGDKDVAVKIAEHPLGTCFGTINADDAEVLRPYLLDARVDDTAGLL